MNPLSFEEALEHICAEDERYDPDAYRFIRDALDYTIRLLDKPRAGQGRHVSGHELLDGIRHYALAEFGPMALRVLHTWGLRETGDFGEIVFHLVDLGVLGRTEEDRREDFSGGYDFDEAFGAPFRPVADATIEDHRPGRSAARPKPRGNQQGEPS